MNAGLHHKRKKGMYSLLTIDGETVEIDGETEETVADSIFLDSKFTADGDRGHEIKRHLVLGRKSMTNLDSMQ